MHDLELLRRRRLLRDKGVAFHPKTRFQGTTPNRRQLEIENTLDRVEIPISDREWADVMIRDRSDYLGGCCTTLDELQDRILGVMRDDGRIKNSDLLEIGMLMRSHGDFDAVATMNTQELEELIARWDQLGAVNKIGLVFTVAEPMLQEVSYRMPRNLKDTPEDLIQALASSFHRFSWADLFTESNPVDKDSRHAQQIEEKAQILPMLRKLIDKLETDEQVIEGYALVTSGTDDVLATIKGLCIYTSVDAARQMVEMWERSGADACELRAARISVSEGVVLGELVDLDQ